jgi:hypothetical protein
MYTKFYFVRFIISFLLLSSAIGNIVNGQVVTDSSCGVIYQCTSIVPYAGGDATYPYNQIRTLNPGGSGGVSIFNSLVGPCYDAITGAALPIRSVLKNASAIAYDVNTNRIYFVNNTTTNSPAEELCYIDLNTSPVSAKKFVSHPLETNAGTGYNITRMTFGSDGYGYAVTENGRDFIRFSIDTATGLPVINQLGALINDSANGAHDILGEAAGDICSDGSGRIYFVPNSGNVYTIDPATQVATYYGTISGKPVACNSVAMTADGHLYIGGGYQSVYEVTLSTLTAIQVNGSTSNVYRTSDYASCSFAVKPARVSTGGVTLSDKADPILLDQHIAIQVKPNPFLQDLTLTIQLNKAEPVRIRLIDFYGRSVFTASQKLGAGVNTLQVSVPAGLSNGIYVLELSAGNNRLLQKKLIKQ